MIPFFGLFNIFRRFIRVPEFRALLFLETLLLLSGTVFYMLVEKWDWLDALYFCVVTLATVGYGDLHPTTPLGKLFAIPYIIFGVALLGVFIHLAGKTALETLEERVENRQKAKSKERSSSQGNTT